MRTRLKRAREKKPNVAEHVFFFLFFVCGRDASIASPSASSRAFSSSSSFAHSLSNVSSSARTPGSETSHSWYSGYRVATGGLFRSRNVDDAASAAKPCVSRCDFETRVLSAPSRSPLVFAFDASNQVSSRRISRHCSLASRARTRGSYPRRTHSRRNGPSLNRNANSGKARSRIAPAVLASATSVAGRDSSSASCAHTVRISNAASIASAASFETPRASRASATVSSASAGGTDASANVAGSAKPPAREAVRPFDSPSRRRVRRRNAAPKSSGWVTEDTGGAAIKPPIVSKYSNAVSSAFPFACPFAAFATGATPRSAASARAATWNGSRAGPSGIAIANACPFGTETYAMVGSIARGVSSSFAFVSVSVSVPEFPEFPERSTPSTPRAASSSGVFESRAGAIPESAASVGSSAARVCW